eukprot:TRINITY_DN1287_c0_g1_i1.p1 TRINITY_DN1287_c0_g1~~TRINITY_DN1287_c0_g1_i1.p1  ORF type:complete len:494 (-),score=145.43 TRINITY_DN1287_c0_g1_i1:74-1555(-)
MAIDWLWVPASAYAYYLLFVTPVAWIASRLLNDEDDSVVRSSSSSPSTKKAGGASSKRSASFPLNQKSPKSLLTILVLILVSVPFYLPIIYFLRADRELPKDMQSHVIARFFISAVATFMNFRVLQLIVFTPIPQRREWGILRFFVECTSLVASVDSNENSKRKEEIDEDEDDSDKKKKQKQKQAKSDKATKKPLKPLTTWGAVFNFSVLYFGSAIVKFAIALALLWVFRDTDARAHEQLPTVNDIAGAVPNLFLGLPPLSYRVVTWADFFYFFAYHAAHGIVFFSILSAFSDFGAGFNALLLGPNNKERIVGMWNYPLFATSPRDFWGRRWNLLFRVIFHQLVFVPIALYIDPLLAYLDMQTGTKKKKRVPTHLVKKTSLLSAHRASPEGRLIAATTVFFFSGVLHEWFNYIAFGEYTMENLAFFLVQAAACAIQTQMIQTYPTWKMGKFSSTAERVLYWALNSLFLLTTAPLFFAPFHRNDFFARFRSLFI